MEAALQMFNMNVHVKCFGAGNIEDEFTAKLGNEPGTLPGTRD